MRRSREIKMHLHFLKVLSRLITPADRNQQIILDTRRQRCQRRFERGLKPSTKAGPTVSALHVVAGFSQRHSCGLN